MLKNKFNNLINNKYFIPIIIILTTIVFFLIINLIFEPRYETIDDFMMMNIISKSDGTYSFYSVYIHPFFSFLIMLLYKTGLNINCYTFSMLLVQFISFVTIGIILMNKNKKIGFICYLFIIFIIYSRILLIINFTGIATSAIIAGITSLMFSIEHGSKRLKIWGLILIVIGVMIRWHAIIIVLPFYIVYSIYNYIKYKRIQPIKMIVYIVGILIISYTSNTIIYQLNPTYREYNKFNKVRSYLFDKNVLDYYDNKELFEKIGWTYTDWKMFYTYTLSDENFFTTEKLLELKSNINNSLETDINKVDSTIELLFESTKSVSFIYLVIGILLIVLIAYATETDRVLILLFVLLHLLLNFILVYEKYVYRTIISLYSSTFLMMIYIILDLKTNKDKHIIYDNIKKIAIIIILIAYFVWNNLYIYKSYKGFNKDNYALIKDLISYTNANTDNVYIYTGVLGNLSLAYSIYEKIPDNTFINFRHAGDWDMYNNEYYEFKKRYNIENIMTDLYTKENMYIITGNVYGADNKIYFNHIETIREYIYQHYNIKVNYQIVKEFSNSVKIYKINEEQ